MRHSTQIFPMMEPTQVQTHHCELAIKFLLPSLHQKGILPDFASHIHNFHKNKNMERRVFEYYTVKVWFKVCLTTLYIFIFVKIVYMGSKIG